MIQIISNNRNLRTVFSDSEVTLSLFSSPRSLDDFSINLVDLQYESLWCNQGDAYTHTDCYADFVSLARSAAAQKKSVLIVLVPGNYTFHYYRGSAGYYHSVEMKNIIDTIPHYLKAVSNVSLGEGALLFERTSTVLNGTNYEADFSFCGGSALTASSPGGKTTTIRQSGIYFTSLNILQSALALQNYLACIGLLKQQEAYPAWLSEYPAFDDEEQRRCISSAEEEMQALGLKIKAAQEKLASNMRYKSVLSANGSELVSVVDEMLETVLDCSLQDFVDRGKEDFLIQKPSVTFVGEIKGVTSNVRSEYVSQADTHCQGYLDKLRESGKSENAKPLLIINPLRTTPPGAREAVCDDQIRLAERNNELMIETKTLLSLFEQVRAGRLTADRCIGVFAAKTGLLDMTDFGAQDHSPFAV